MGKELFEKLQELSGLIPSNFNVIDEPIDMQLQMDYFKRSKNVKSANSEKVSIDTVGDLFDSELTDEQLMDRMILLASIDDPKAFRILEEYSKDASNRLHQWSLMATQESRMLIEGNLLEESQVFVSTGLGGRGRMLRYFVALVGNNIDEFVPYQRHIVQSEFETALKNNGSELEKIEFNGHYSALTMLIPLDVAIQQLILEAIDECNQYGDFIQSDFLLTNVKILSFEEIDQYVNSEKSDDDPNIDIDFADNDADSEGDV